MHQNCIENLWVFSQSAEDIKNNYLHQELWNIKLVGKFGNSGRVWCCHNQFMCVYVFIFAKLFESYIKYTNYMVLKSNIEALVLFWRAILFFYQLNTHPCWFKYSNMSFRHCGCLRNIGLWSRCGNDPILARYEHKQKWKMCQLQIIVRLHELVNCFCHSFYTIRK